MVTCQWSCTFFQLIIPPMKFVCGGAQNKNDIGSPMTLFQKIVVKIGQRVPPMPLIEKKVVKIGHRVPHMTLFEKKKSSKLAGLQTAVSRQF